MTSKLSFCSLRRENLKSRLGIILVVGFIFFAYMIHFLISVQNISNQYDNAKDIRKSITSISEPRMIVGVYAILAAVLLAVSSFRYLHSKKETDFYHSLPIRRRTYLYIIMTNDLLVIAFYILLLSVFQCVITAAVGYFSLSFGRNVVWSFICYISVFTATYVTMVFAMVLTGNTFVSLLSFAMLSSYMPVMLRNLYPCLASVFYRTYCENLEMGGFLSYLSPLSLANKLFTDYNGWTFKAHSQVFTVIWVWIIVMCMLDFILFERRPSEMAGKAMAFPKANAVIRILLVIPISIYAGIYLYSASFSSIKTWIAAGMVIGGFLAHGIIECIYRFDIRGLLSQKRQMVVSLAAAFLLVGIFWTDIFGYDIYLPESGETEAVLIDENYISDGFWGKEREGVSGETKKAVLNTLQDVVNENDKNSEDCDRNGRGTEYSFYTIRYRLKNGRDKRRVYVLDSKLEDRLMSEVFDTKEYREDTYPLYTADWSQVTNVELCHFMENMKLHMTKKQQAELFGIYLEEFSELDYEAAKTNIPFGYLLISHDESGESRGQNDFNTVSHYSGMDSYYIYPSFKKTIGYLENLLDEKIPLSFEELSITNIEMWRYGKMGLQGEYSVKDEETIQLVKDKLFGSSVWESGRNIFYPLDTSVDIRITVESAEGIEYVNVYTDEETIEMLERVGDGVK